MSSPHTRMLFRSLAALLLAVFVVYGVLFGLLVSVRAATAPLNIFTYEGRLLNSNGVPVADTTASITFALYSALTGGTCAWSNSSATCVTTTARTVTLTDGLFSENLGDTSAATPYAAIADTVFGNDASVFLEVIVNGETLSPRKLITAAPYALNANLLDGLDSTQTGGVSAAVVALDSSGNLTLTGSPAGSGVSQGSLYVNPATGVVATDETLFGVAVSGTSRFRVDGEGDTYLLGDFAVGGTSLTAPFSVDESLNTLRIGDAANDTNDPSITFYASDATDSGTLSYADADVFTFAGGDINHVGTGAIPASASGTARALDLSTTFTSTSGNSLSTLQFGDLFSTAAYSGIQGTSTTHYVYGASGVLTISGSTATMTRGYGVRGAASNTSTNASLLSSGGYLVGVEGDFTHNATGTTLTTAYGVHGTGTSTLGEISTAVGVRGDLATGVGTISKAYGGMFSNAVAGSTRYGIYAEASGGATANYAAYFASAGVQIDDDASADTPGLASGAGDLYVVSDLEVDGIVQLGDTTGTDSVLVTSAVTTGTALRVTSDSVTSGSGFAVARAAGGADFDGVLASFTQNNVAGTSDADAVAITNMGAGNAVGLYITQNTLSAHSANATGNNALVVDVNEASGNEDAMMIRSDADGTADTEFRVESDGDVFGDGASYTSGADYAEFFKTSDSSLGDYQIVCQDPAVSEAVRRCPAGDTAYVMGVVSTNAAFVGNNFRGASDDLSNDKNYAKVGMVGQIDTLVNAAEGAIAIGDPITSSALLSGYGAKMTSPSRIVGFALEPLASGTGIIRVLVQPQWYGGDVLNDDGTADDDRNEFVLAESGKASRLSVVNTDGSQDAFVDTSGNFALAGKLFLSDNGVLQTSKYVMYDGTSDVVRTNASGWGSSASNFAEMFATKDLLAPGEVVIFAASKEEIARSSGEQYDAKIAGVMTTHTGFVAGENTAGTVPVALSGRVSTYVSGENGDIAIGDPLTTSSKPGYAMKATNPGQIVGYAMDTFSGVTGVVTAFIRPSYYDGVQTDAPIAENTISDVSSVAKLDVSGSMNMNGGSILSIASLSGIGNNWSLLENGDFLTHGRFISLIRSYGGEDVPTYGVTDRENVIQLSGTTMLVDGKANIDFEKIDPLFNDIIANTVPYRVLVTPAGMTGTVYVAERTNEGFTVRDTQSTTGVAVDWLVIAYHKDFAPENVPTPDVIAETPVENVVTEHETDTTDTIEALNTTPLEDTPPVADEPVVEPTVSDTTEILVVDDALIEEPITEESIAP